MTANCTGVRRGRRFASIKWITELTLQTITFLSSKNGSLRTQFPFHLKLSRLVIFCSQSEIGSQLKEWCLWRTKGEFLKKKYNFLFRLKSELSRILFSWRTPWEFFAPTPCPGSGWRIFEKHPVYKREGEENLRPVWMGSVVNWYMTCLKLSVILLQMFKFNTCIFLKVLDYSVQ